MDECPWDLHLELLQWLEEQKNEPDRSDWYLMQIALEVRRKFSRENHRLEHMLIEWGPSEAERYPKDPPPGFPKLWTKESIARAKKYDLRSRLGN